MNPDFLDMTGRELFSRFIDGEGIKHAIASIMKTKDPEIAALYAKTLRDVEKTLREPQFSFLYDVVYEGGKPEPAAVFAKIFSHKLDEGQAEGLAGIAIEANDTDAAAQIAYHLHAKLGSEHFENLLELASENDRWTSAILNDLNDFLTHDQKELIR